MSKVELLNQSFHALEGATLQEKRKSFNHLLDRIKEELTTQKDLNDFVVALTPTDKLEEILRVEIFIRFQRNAELLNVLKSGNVSLIKKVLNYWKFFESAFVELDGKTLVEDVFPHTSFSARMKIITKLAANLKNETQADSYFAAIENKYGLQVASSIIPGCSLNLIKSTVKAHMLKLSNRQLLKIFRRDRDFLTYYFELFYKRSQVDRAYSFSNEYGAVLKHVARVDTDLFWKLCDKYELDIKFGRHMTPYMYGTEHKYGLKCFNAKKVYLAVHKDEKKLEQCLLALYPEHMSIFNCEYGCNSALTKFFNYIPRARRFSLLSNCFEKKYGKNLLEDNNWETMYENLLKIMPAQERRLILDKKILKDESWIYMEPIHLSIPILKERIRYTSKKETRAELVGQLCRACNFNDDAEALLDVLKYVRAKYKGNEVIVRSFMDELLKWKGLEKLSQEHWTYIKELLKPLCADLTSYYNYYQFIEPVFVHALDNNRIDDELIKVFARKVIGTRSYYNMNENMSQTSKMCFEQLTSLVPKLFVAEEYQDAGVSLLSAMVFYNRYRKGKFVLSDYPNYVEIAESQLSKENCHDAECVMKYCVRHENHRNVDYYDRVFWTHYKQLHDLDTSIWYLRNKPLQFLENIDEVLKHTTFHTYAHRTTNLLFKQLNLYRFSGVTEKIVSFALDSLKSDVVHVEQFPIVALSHVTSERDYLEATKSLYPPDDGKIDFENTEKKQLEVQETFLRSLSNFDHPVVALPVLLKFCKADYLKYGLRPLYKVVSHTPEMELDQFFDSLFKSAVSVRKHAVSLITAVGTKEKIRTFLKQTGESDDHPTLRKTTFKSTLRYFVENPSEAFWNLLSHNIKIIDKDDKEAFEHLLNLKAIPESYLPRYIPIVYDVLAGNETKDIHEKKWDLLTRIPDDVLDDLDQEFLKTAITDTLFIPSYRQSFCLNCIFHTTKEKQEELLRFSLEIFGTYGVKHFSGQALRNVDDFLYEFCQKSIAFTADETILKKVIATTVVKNEPSLLLRLTQEYLSCRCEDRLPEFGIKAQELFSNWIEEVGDISVIHIFTEVLESFLNSFLQVTKDQDRLLVFVENFCSAKSSPYNYGIAANILFNARYVNTRFNDIIRACQVPSVQVRFRHCLKTSKG